MYFSLTVSLILLLSAGPLASQSLPPETRASTERRTPIIRVETTAVTWRARQRVSFPLSAAIRQRLIAAGLQVTLDREPSPQASPDAVLRVEYREERGQQVTLDIYGTEVTCHLTLDRPDSGQLLTLTIKESPSYGGLSTLPYIDVIQQFETNPYFYFLGDVVGGALDGRTADASLLTALARYAAPKAPRSSGSHPYPEASESLPSFDPQYEQQAVSRTIQELARLNPTGAGGIFAKLLTHADWHVRRQAVLGLKQIGAGDSIAALSEVSRHDPEAEVRHAAEEALGHLDAGQTAR